MAHLVELDQSHLNKWATLKEYLVERPEVRAYVLIDQIDPVSILLSDGLRIHYFLTDATLRNGGYANTLLELYTQRYVTGRITTSVPKENHNAIKTLLKAGFDIIGFNHTTSNPAYLFEYVKDRLVAISPRVDYETDLADVLSKTKVVEVLPIKL